MVDGPAIPYETLLRKRLMRSCDAGQKNDLTGISKDAIVKAICNDLLGLVRCSNIWMILR